MLTTAHWYSIYLVNRSKGRFVWQNENPRAFVTQIAARPALGDKKSEHTELEKTVLRCQSCQANGFENLPIYIGTLVSCSTNISSAAMSLASPRRS